MGALEATLGAARAKLYSPHSWRVWIASSLRMCNASDARIQAMGRWLNPESIKIYSRMSKQEYALWVDKLMAVRRIDTARTTSLPTMDAADAILLWGEELRVGTGREDGLRGWGSDQPDEQPVGPPPLKKGERLEVYWTEDREWFPATFISSAIEEADGGGRQRTSRILYDAVGLWGACHKKDLIYAHCLDDEIWRREA